MCPEKSSPQHINRYVSLRRKEKTIFRREIKRQKAGGEQHQEMHMEHMTKHLLLMTILSCHPSVSAEGFCTL